MRIMIAEDELLERKAMRKFIHEQFVTMEVVAEAENGRKAIALAEALQPDLILMDIQMPGINGLEAIEAIHTANPSIKFILVSAYDSFAYAKEAMRFGIKDYILKPGKKEEVSQALLRVENELKADQQKLQLLKQQWMADVIHYPVPQEAKQLQQQLFPSFQSATFLVIQTKNQDEIGVLLQKTIDLPCIISLQNSFVIALVISEDILQKSQLLHLARKLQLFAEGTFIGLGDVCHRIDKLPDAYQTAYSACLQHARERTSGYGFFHRGSQVETDAHWQQEVFAAIERGHISQVDDVWKQYAQYASNTELAELYMDVVNLLRSKHVTLESGMFSLEQAAQDWQAFIKLCAMKMNGYYQSKKYAAQIENYISAHFREKVSLEDAAEAVDLSPNYFSNLFKQEFGINFTDYMNRLRMEAAKTMIADNKLSIKQISYELGYKDPNYFSRVFKKYFAESPKSFQKGIFK